MPRASRVPISPSTRAKIEKVREIERAGQFVVLCRRFNLPLPRVQFQFEPPRRWMFDFCWTDVQVALECQGGLFTGGRHVRGAALLKEHEKMNHAAILGWRVLYTTPDQLCTYGTIRQVGAALGLSVPPLGTIP